MMKHKENSPPYIKNANFINADEDVTKSHWPRELSAYNKTEAWKRRTERLSHLVDKQDIEITMSDGELYSSIKTSVTFARSIMGVAMYVIVSSELQKYYGSYPKKPTRDDYEYNAVSVWLYVYDQEMAELFGTWSNEDLAYINNFCESESF
ncbi:MAG: hypothetical protein J07AB43_02210 [Candidatus Nanosalina sp. J07AB43]|jgi:hypothetical protein|nr:MAG: hypothetical protein J07AB43_02210 [Candidatus Nanosalina sp. J07AB43]